MKNTDYKAYTPDNSFISDNNSYSIQTHNIKRPYDNQEDFKKDLIKIFIYIFYYEKICSEKNADIFKKKDRYYIINPYWLYNYKQYYNYEQLENLLKKENKNINYFNLDKYYNNIAQNCLKNDNILNFEKKELSQELRTNISYIIKKDYDIHHFFKGLIMPSKIMNIIKSIHNINNKSILPHSIIFNNNNIFFIKINNIIVGNDNDIPRILSKYVFNYKDNNTLNTEKNEILLHNINEYIQLRKCNENSEDLQILKNEKNEEIGKFFVVNYINKKNSQTKKLVSNERNQNGFSNKSHPKYKNNKISLIPHKQNYQKRNNNFINLTMPATLDNKNFQNLVNNQNINNKDSKNSENNNFSEAKTLKEENYKLKNENENLKNINLQMKQELDIAKNLINIYQNKEDHKNSNKFMNENIKNENKEILIDKENNEFEKNENINQENNIEINNQIEKTEKQLNNLNNQILPNQDEQSQNNQYMNYNNDSQNDMALSESIGPTTIIRNIERNRKNNNQIDNNQMFNNQEGNNQINNSQMNNNQVNNNIIYNYDMNNNIGINGRNNDMNNNFEMNNNINFEMNNNNIFGMNNGINFKMNNNNNVEMNSNNNFEIDGFTNLEINNNKNVGMNNNNIFGMNNNNFELNNNNNFGINNNISSGMDNKNIFGIKNKNQRLEQIRNQLNPKRIISKNKEILIENKINNPIPIKTYSKPTLIGLNNIGSTSFKNAVLQCLSQTEDLTNYFLKESSKEDIFNNNIEKQNKNALQLCPIYYELIQNLWSKNEINSYSPKSFIDLIDQLSKDNNILQFKSDEAGDEKDFIIFVLERFHKELQKPLKSNNISKNNKSINQYEKEKVADCFLTEFQESGSIISDIFFGVNETNTICLNCKDIYNSKGLNNPICYNYELFNLLIFPLEEVRKFKNRQMESNNINMNQNNIVNLYECFAYNEKEELFTGDNKNACNICRQLSDALYKSKIFISPNVLILLLNRGKGNESNVKLDFNESIDITQFVLKKDMPKITYNLYGVITSILENESSTHFISSCKSPVDNKWYRYNDSNVTQIQNLQKEVIDYGIPYILFYKKCI